jgi:hypothetical protein
MLEGMKTTRRAPLITLGGLVENFNNAYGERCALGFLRLAARARLIMFRGRGRDPSSRGKAKA